MSFQHILPKGLILDLMNYELRYVKNFCCASCLSWFELAVKSWSVTVKVIEEVHDYQTLCIFSKMEVKFSFSTALKCSSCSNITQTSLPSYPLLNQSFRMWCMWCITYTPVTPIWDMYALYLHKYSNHYTLVTGGLNTLKLWCVLVWDLHLLFLHSILYFKLTCN